MPLKSFTLSIKYQYNYCIMNQSNLKTSINLDLQNHSLNKSSSKQRYKFPKAERFNHSTNNCDSFYELPSTRSRRGTSFGYGEKDMGIRSSRYNADPCTYNIDVQQKHKRTTSFGPGRQQMAMGGPMKDSMLQKYIPGPGNYKNYSTLDNSKITLKSRLQDKSQNHLLKNPGPGQYQQPQIGKDQYYVTSKFPNKTNFAKIHPPSVEKPANRTISVGPGQCNQFCYEDETDLSDLKPDGRYVLSKNKGSNSRQFAKGQRQSIIYKHLLSTPGPTQYTPFTYFGNA